MTETSITSLKTPAEWQPQRALWCGWPSEKAWWGEAFQIAQDEIAEFVRAAAEFVSVRLVVGNAKAAGIAAKMVGDCADIVELPMGDIWLRDIGPIFTRGAEGPEALLFQTNGWGGKYLMPGDELTGGAITKTIGWPARVHDFILEGGAVEMDGAGRLITTRQCMLNPNRNPDWTEDLAESALRESLGVQDIIWLDNGLAGDHTDGHVDNLARFIAPGCVICQTPSGGDDPNADILRGVENALRDAGLDVLTIPSPGRITGADGAPLPASHLNFVITNGAVIMPAFEGVFSASAMTGLAECFPRYEIIALPANAILTGGGTFHCMTREQPDFGVET